METVPIDNLRIAFAQSIIATMATQVSTYLRLAAHPDLQFSDLLDALSRNAVIGDDAANRLHRRLGVAPAGIAPQVQRAYWEQVLKDRGIAITALVREQPAATVVVPPLAPAPEAAREPVPAAASSVADIPAGKAS